MKKSLIMTFFLCFALLYTYGQSRSVSGTITDQESGEPLIGVVVAAKGTKSSAMTDVNGKFTLSKLPDQGEITITTSYLGYVAQEKKASAGNVLNFQLSKNVTGLNEVVVVGYGTMKRSDLTGAVSSVSGKEIAAVPVPNAAQALAGRLPGVSVTTQDGRPDAGVSIRVRGGGSISQSNEPLFIVDGFPVATIADIPANQIESIDVLKDASSTAIYGARGANGVIIVTTKSGKTGKLTINYDGFAKFNTPTKYLPTMNAYNYLAYNWGYAQAISDSYANAWEQLWAIGDFADDFNNAEGIEHYRNVAATNYSKEAYGDSFSHNHNVSISSGTEKTKFLLAFNHINEEGMKVNSSFKRTNASLKLDQQLAKTLNLSLDTRFTDITSLGDEGTTNGRGSILSSAYQFRPIATADVLGELDPSVNTQLGFYENILIDRYNPVARMMDFFPEERNRSIRANTALSWEIIKGLTARTDLGLNTFWNRSREWSGAVYNDYLDANGAKVFGGNATLGYSQGWNLRWSNTLNYEVQGLGEKHSLNALVGQELMNSGSDGTSIWGRRYPASYDMDKAFAVLSDFYQDPNVLNSGFSSSSGVPNRLYSFFGRANYVYNSKYLFSATFRADGSSRFSPNHRWGYFPAAAIGWRVSEEDFLQDVDWLYNLKVRFSYGSVGNDGIDANLWRLNWKSSGLTGYSINGSQQTAYVPESSVMPNPNLKWETTITRNLGFDYGLFNNRVYGSLELYKNSTKDLLMISTVPPYGEAPLSVSNVGNTSNRGIEFSIAGDVIRKDHFNLTVGGNININRGKIEELDEGINGLYKTQWGSSMTQPNTGDYILQVGKPVGQVRGYVYDGWYDVDDFNYSGGTYTLKDDVADIASGILGTVYGTTAHKPGGQVAYPGVIKYKDISGPDGVPDGIIDENDVTIIGDMNPKHTGGLNISGNYRSIDFRLDFNWSVGNQVYNANYLAAFYGSKEDGLYKNRLDYLSGAYRIYDIQNGQITSVTDPAELKALNANATTFLPYHENPVASSLGIEDGSFLRLNTVTLGYTLPKTLTNKIGLTNFRVYGSVYNALVFTNYRGLDPEVNSNTNQGNAQYPTTGLDWGSYPRARSFTIGVNAQF